MRANTGRLWLGFAVGVLAIMLLGSSLAEAKKRKDRRDRNIKEWRRSSRGDVLQPIRHTKAGIRYPMILNFPKPQPRSKPAGSQTRRRPKFYGSVRRAPVSIETLSKSRLAGLAQASLPVDAKSYEINGQPYFHAGNNFFKPITVEKETLFLPVAPPVGLKLAGLPGPASEVKVADDTVYYCDGSYFKKTAKDGKTVYTVVKPPRRTGGKPRVIVTDPKAPDPFSLLKKMNQYISELQQVTITASSTVDDVLADGQKLQFSRRHKIYLQRPDKLTVMGRVEGRWRQIVFDGKTVSALNHQSKQYVTRKLTGTIETLLDELATRFGNPMPMGDLLYRDAYDSYVAHAVSGQYIGESTIAFYRCHHLAFIGERADWELWIQADGKPIPRKVVVRYKHRTGEPRYSLLLSGWDTTVEIPPPTFKFEPPAGATQVQLTPAAGGQE